MPITIQLDDDLADQLQRRAACRQLSLEEFALRLLGGALGELEAAETWELHNRRRLTLIRKSPASGLSASEQAELQDLQATLDQRLEPIDDQVLAGLQHLQQAMAQGPKNGEGRTKTEREIGNDEESDAAESAKVSHRQTTAARPAA